VIHLQYNTPGWNEALTRLPDGALVKLVDMVQTAVEVKATNPKLKVLLRHVNNSGYVWSTDWAANVAQAEKEYLTYIDGTFAQYAHLVDYVEEPRNEYVDDGSAGRGELASRVLWARACAYVWKVKFQPQWPHIRVLIGSQPVGNNIPLGFFKAAHDFGAGISTHAYIHFTAPGVRDPLDFRYHSGRWSFDDTAARAAGYNVPIAITETGPYRSTYDGWKSAQVLGGNVAAYVAAVEQAINDWKTTNAYQTGRLLGFNLFTTIQDNDAMWKLYATNQPALNQLAEMVKRVWVPVAVPPPPPPPVEERQWDKLVYLVPQGTTEAQYEAVTQMAYDTRSEVTFSADAAFDRPSKAVRHTVVVYDAAGWGGQAALAAWVAAHYSFSPATVVEFREWPLMPPPTTPGEWDFPIGTAAERAAAVDDWPGAWFDANGYGNLYTLNGKQVYHTGVDLNCNEPGWDADKGAPVYAAAAGVVTYAQLVQGSTWGKLVVVQHGPSLFTRYAHLADYTVQPGQTVAKGQQIGSVGGVEYGLPNHLHFDISPTDRLLTYPLDWPGLTWSRIVTDYTEPLAYILARKQG
jgi:murein DD-endopeptidase MepM/ murein hydrolase activator NlpD